MPEVSLVAILDADKEGFLRSETSLIQTIGRAARNAHGKVIMYADRITDSMQKAIDETMRRREVQDKYNQEHHITPKTIQKKIKNLIERLEGKTGEERSAVCVCHSCMFSGWQSRDHQRNNGRTDWL